MAILRRKSDDPAIECVAAGTRREARRGGDGRSRWREMNLPESGRPHDGCTRASTATRADSSSGCSTFSHVALVDTAFNLSHDTHPVDRRAASGDASD